MSTPQSTIYLLNVPNLDSTYQHSIYWDKATQTASDQANYFTGKAGKFFLAYTYLRREWSIKVNATMEEADRQGWNYLCFQNVVGGKYFYYFINKYEYINDSTIELFLEMDVLQTWYFELNLMPSFVERETVSSDKVGEHTIDEGLETGELVTRYHDTIDMGTSDMDILIMETVDGTYGRMINGVYSGLQIKAIHSSKYGALNNYLSALESAGNLDRVVAIWQYPSSLVHTVDSAYDQRIKLEVVDGLRVNSTVVLNPAVSIYSRDGYNPIKNNKLYTFPYQVLYITNNTGASAVYRLERFIAGERDDNSRWFKPEFTMFGAISPEAPVKIAPRHYENVGDMYDYGLTSASFPSCAWDSDPYKIWLAQNQSTQKVAMIDAGIKAGTGVVSALASAFTGNLLGAAGGVGVMYNGATQIANLIAQKKDMDVQPSQSRGAFSVSVNMASGRPAFEVYFKELAPEYANMIDDYFSMYGYKVNTIKTPSLNNRKWYTYVKTQGCNLSGGMPNDVSVKIKSIFDNGVTWWKSSCVMIGNYNLMADNTPNG